MRCALLAHALAATSLFDFGAVLIGYILSGEPTRLPFYKRLAPFASPFIALDAARSVASSLHLVPISGGSRPAHGEGASHALSTSDLLARKPFPSLGGLFAPLRRAVGGNRRGRNPTNCPRALLCRKRMLCLLPIAGLRWCALQATPGASEGKSFVLGQ